MIQIDYPEPSFKLKKQNGLSYLFDPIRKKWIVLTPEEWVRQNFIQFLIQKQNFPSSLIALEKEIKLGELKKRFDVLIYNSGHQPLMMIECKAPSIVLNDTVLQQVLRYNISTPVNYLVITNGDSTYGWVRNNNDLQLMDEIPGWNF